VGLVDHAIAIIDVEGLVAVDADVAAAGDHAEARLTLTPIDPAQVVAPPKAATWHEAVCGPHGQGCWHARILIDR
jgi:SHS2 domain-containing protein